MTQPQLVELRDKMDRSFSVEETARLCSDMGADYDGLPGEGKAAKIRELIGFCHRRGRLEELLARVQAARPQITWPGVDPASITFA